MCFDTDLLGTFSGELQRKDDALTTLRNKCIGASIANNCDLIFASEGSFARILRFFLQMQMLN
jgi:hypothetical protein